VRIVYQKSAGSIAHSGHYKGNNCVTFSKPTLSPDPCDPTGMKAMRKPAARFFTTSTIRKIPLAIASSPSVNSRFKANRSLLLVSLFAIGAVSTAAPAPAGSGGFNKTGSMNNARLYTTATLLANGEVLAAGGANNANPPLTSAELYNSATGTWIPTGSMPSGFECDGSATLMPNGQVLAICFGAASLYDPSTGAWTATSQPPPAAGGGRMGVLPNGQVWNEGDLLYSPSTGQWTAFTTPAPCSKCRGEDEVLLANGKVLGAGGEQGTFGYSTFGTIKNAELFDPSTLTWTSTGSMIVSRTGETLTLLSNGQALAAGGQTFDKNKNMLVTITSAELYTP